MLAAITQIADARTACR